MAAVMKTGAMVMQMRYLRILVSESAEMRLKPREVYLCPP